MRNGEIGVILKKGLSALSTAIRVVLVAGIEFYRYALSGLFASHCRFEPSCSSFAIQALEELPLKKALILIVKRLVKCQPWGGSGFDPVPQKNKLE